MSCCCELKENDEIEVMATLQAKAATTANEEPERAPLRN